MDINEIICYCSNVTKGEIIKAIDDGAKTLDDIKRMTNACTGGKCRELNPKRKCCSTDILKILDDNK